MLVELVSELAKQDTGGHRRYETEESVESVLLAREEPTEHRHQGKGAFDDPAAPKTPQPVGGFAGDLGRDQSGAARRDHFNVQFTK